MKLIFKEDELPQRSPEWKEKRGKHIGGSDVAILTGDLPSAWDTAHDLFLRKIGEAPPKEMNAAMTRGTELEDEAKQYIERYLSNTHSRIVVLNPLVAIHPDDTCIMVSFDGVDEQLEFIVEIKCQSEKNFTKTFLKGIPEYYVPQIQAQLHVANAHWGITKGYFCSYYPEPLNFRLLDENKEPFDVSEQLACIPVEYDVEYGKYLGSLCKNFQEMVDKKEWNHFWDII